MIIKSLSVRYLGEPERKPILFNNIAHYFVSDDNSKGKTTLLRLIGFALCFNVPMTKGLESSKIETVIVVERNNKEITIVRSGNNATIVRNKNNISLDLRKNDDFANVVTYVFGIEKTIENGDLLGTFFVDQDNGWNLLSSGKVVGETKFSVSNAIVSLFSIDTSDIDRQISSMDREIKKYQLVEKAIEIKNESPHNTSLVSDNAQNCSNKELLEQAYIQKNKLLRQRDKLRRQIQHIIDVINSKESIESYIDELNILVYENPNSQPFRLTKDKMFMETASIDGLRAQRMLYESNLKDVYKQLEKCNSDIESMSETLADIKKASTEIEIALQNVPNLSLSRTAAIIEELKKEKNALADQRHALLSFGNSSQFLDTFDKLFKKHLTHFNMLETVYGADGIKIEYYQNRGRFSGAELAKVVLSYKLAFHETFSKETKTKLPLIIDSPGSKELKDEIVIDIINYSLEYGTKNGFQVFISTVKTEGLELTINNHHRLCGKAIDLFEEGGLF